MNSEFSKLPLQFQILIIFIAIWTLFWKGFGLWRSARNEQKVWFMVFFLTSFVNIMGLLEIIYLFGFAKKKMTLNDLAFWKSKSKT
jgi:hypothetical protein